MAPELPHRDFFFSRFVPAAKSAHQFLITRMQYVQKRRTCAVSTGRRDDVRNTTCACHCAWKREGGGERHVTTAATLLDKTTARCMSFGGEAPGSRTLRPSVHRRQESADGRLVDRVRIVISSCFFDATSRSLCPRILQCPSRPGRPSWAGARACRRSPGSSASGTSRRLWSLAWRRDVGGSSS